MFKNSKPSKPARKPGGGAAMMQQMGFQMPNFDGSGMGGDEDDDDDDLEAELQRLQQGMGGNAGSKARQSKGGAAGQDLQAFHNDVSKLLHDIDRPMNDDELSDVDEDELLAELNEMTDEFEHESHEAPKKQAQAASTGNVLSVLESRQQMYTKALAAAKTSGDASKARRLDRQLKTIQTLLQSARSGAPIDESEIPPEVFVAGSGPSVPEKAPPAAQSPPAPQPRAAPAPRPSPPAAPHSRAVPLPTPAAKNDPVVYRTQAPPAASPADQEAARLKALALQAKQRGDMAKAKEYIIQLRELQGRASVAAPPPRRESYDNVPNDDAPPPSLPLKAPEPRTVMEALQQRHEELSKRGEEAATKGDTSKARRMERLSKQYEEAMDATRKGRPYDYNELPELPGFAPIPVQQAKPQPAAPGGAAARPAAAANSQARPAQPQQQRPSPQAATTSSTTARKSQQAQALRLKQAKFYKLAGEAKQRGDVETAKKFLIAYKGLDQMIAAAEAGLPVDMGQVPKLPDDDNNDTINDDDLTQDLARADRDTIYRRLQEDLLRQIQLCARNEQIYTQMEEPNSHRHAKEYKLLEQRCAQDLDKLRQCFQQGLRPPLFHYERRQMTVIQTNNDLGENDMEVTIVRGINLPIPSGSSASSLETYVVIEFPYPTDEPQIARTRHGASSTNAEYLDAVHKFYIKRNDAKFKRLMNRKELKLGVFFKAGFLRSDRPLGTASVKLAALEQSCSIHESVDLYEVEHRKKIEGKLEVKVRIKESLGQTKASDILPQRWLVIDSFEDQSKGHKSSSTARSATSSSSTAPAITAIARLVPTGEALGQLTMHMGGDKTKAEVADDSRSSTSEPNHREQRRSQHAATAAAVPTGPQSVQVLNYEASLLRQQMDQLHDQLSSEQRRQLETKLRSIEDQSEQLVRSLRKGGRQFVQEHVRNLEELSDYYDQEAREHHQRRDRKKEDMSLTKMRLVQKEIATLTAPAPPTVTSAF